MQEIVKIENLKKNFGKVEALKDVSFKINAGEVVGFIGPNGAGKTTTIRILLGIIKATGGDATIFNKDVWKDSINIHKRISYVPGDVSLWGNLTGGEIIDLFIKLHGKGNIEKRDYLIEKFKLDPKKKAKTYSKGNRQKVALIAALSVDSDLYLFDEPTSGLDPLMEAIFKEEALKLKQEGKSILLSSHILSEVEKLADRVVIIRDGKIVEEGNLKELQHLTRSNIVIETKKDIAIIKNLKGIHDFIQNNKSAEFSVDNESLDEVLKTLTKLEIITLKINPPTLEEIFMRHYEGL